MSSISIVLLDRETFPSHIQFPRPAYPHKWQAYDYTTSEQTGERIKQADVVIVNKVALNSDQLKQASALKLIALAATGSNNIDLNYCRDHGIAVANIRNYGSHSVAEHTFALMLSLKRRLLSYKQRVAAGEWQEHRQFVLFDDPVDDLNDSSLGIVGKGVLGNQVAKIAEVFGMKVLFAEHKNATSCRSGRIAFMEVLAQSDVLSLHCPLSHDTYQLMGAQEFAMMKRTSLFINTARGALVDEKALADALITGEIAAAGLDVLSSEPPVASNPLLALAAQPNVLITPHTAWTSNQAMENAVQQTMENIAAFLNNKPIRLIS